MNVIIYGRCACVFFSLVLMCVFASDTFSSIAELEKLYEIEQEISSKLELYLQSTRSQMRAIEKYLKEINEIRNSSCNKESIITNPINAFHLMRRLAIQWEEVKTELVTQFNITNLIEDVLHKSQIFPTFDDFSAAAFSLAQLHGAYQLNISQLSRGYVQISQESRHVGFASIRGLNARDCLFIGKHAFNKGLYDQAIEWLQQAAKLASLEMDPSANVGEIQPFLTTAIRVHDDILEKKGPLGPGWRTNPEPVDSRRLERYRRNRRRDSKFNELKTVNSLGLANATSSEHEELQVFYKLCRGKRMRAPSVEKQFHCRYVSHTDPYFILRPLKLEEFSFDPFIGVFRDFMSHREMELFKNFASDHLQRSTYGSKHGAIAGDKRTSKQTWVRDDAHPVIQQVSQRISDAIRLKSTPIDVGSELFQVANYGIGGRYTPHFDFGTVNLNSNERRGDRIATFMTYLQDVEAGGATVFTHAGVTLWPKKGDAAFWWNLNSDLSGDVSTRHGGCPVLHGSKWICNKWFHSAEQIFQRPCDVESGKRIFYP